MAATGGGGKKVVRGKAVKVKPDVIERFGWIEKGKVVRAGSIKRPKPPKGYRAGRGGSW